MAAWWVSAAVEAAPYVYSAFSSSSSRSNQAGLDADYAMSNSLVTRQAGAANANSIMAVAGVNAKLALASAQSNNLKLKAVTEYNSEKSILLGEYNAQLQEQEALLVLEKANLDLVQLRKQQERQIGNIAVAHGASGAIMNQDTPGMVIADAETQAEDERFIVQRGADVQFSKLMDSAAQSRWAGYEQANKMIMENNLIMSNNDTNAKLSAIGTTTQGYMDASTTKYNAGVKADQVFQNGMLSSNSNNYMGSQALWSNMFMAGSSLVSSYLES